MHYSAIDHLHRIANAILTRIALQFANYFDRACSCFVEVQYLLVDLLQDLGLSTLEAVFQISEKRFHFQLGTLLLP
jgi:hypothetical protein